MSNQRKTIVEKVGSLDPADLDGSLDVAIAYLQKVQLEHPNWQITSWYEYDGFQMEFIEHRLENDQEFAARKAQERAARAEKKAAVTREAKREEKRKEIKKLQSELSRL